MRSTRMLVALTVIAAATLGGLTAVNASADTDRQYGRAAAARSGVETAATKPVGGVTAQSAQAIATKTVWTRKHSWITYGGTAILEGQVQTDNGSLPEVTVKLYGKNAGASSYSYLGSDVTDSTNALFRFDRKTPKNTYYQVRFYGTTTHDRSSATALVKVRRAISSYMKDAPSNKFSFYGWVRPNHSGKTVLLHRKTCSSCSWQRATYTRANSDSAYRFTITGPTSPGRTYYYRAVTAADTSYATGYSDIWRVQS